MARSKSHKCLWQGGWCFQPLPVVLVYCKTIFTIVKTVPVSQKTYLVMLFETIRNFYKNRHINFHWLMMLVNLRMDSWPSQMAPTEDARTRERDNAELYLYISNKSKSQEHCKFSLQTLLHISLIPWSLMWTK